MYRIGIILAILVAQGCAQHTRDVWKEPDETRKIYSSNMVGVVFINERQVAVWCSRSEGGGVVTTDGSEFPIANICVKYEVSQNVSNIKGQIDSLVIDDRIEYSEKSKTISATSDRAELHINGKTITAKVIGVSRQVPGGNLHILKSDKINFNRTFVTLRNGSKYETAAERVLVTPISVSLDVIDSAIVVASVPIWAPVLVLLMNSDLKNVN